MRPLSEEEIEILAEKKLLGTISPEESLLLDGWLHQQPGDSMVWVGDTDEEALRQRILRRIRQDAGIGDYATVSLMRRYRWAAAAVFALVLLAGGYFIFGGRERTDENIAAVKDVPPGQNGAVLTLENGKQFTLSAGDAARLSPIAGAKIAQQDGQLVFRQDSAVTATAVTSNTLSTARGRQYRIVLPDGTKVWLNAASALHFPSAFTGRERRVTLEGEAYFEVAKNPLHPFVVTAGNAEVAVLGTHFAIAAYKEEDKLTATLLEGSVSVSSPYGKRVIKPGQQASLYGNAPIQVQQVDTSESIAWVHGQLSLDVQDVPTLMRQIARWYDVDIHYNGTPPNIGIVGMINRNVYLSNLLQALSAYGIKAHLVGRTVVVN